jgi:hypothetical protein
MAAERVKRNAEVSTLVYADSSGSDDEATTIEEDRKFGASSSVGSSSSFRPVTGSHFWALAGDESSDDEEVSMEVARADEELDDELM